MDITFTRFIPRYLLFAEQGLYECAFVKHLKVGDFFAETYVFHRNAQHVAYSDHHTSLCRAVKFGDGKVCHLRGCGELACLLECVLSRRSVEHKQHFVRSSGHDTFHHTLDFRQLIHQSFLVVEATCGVYYHHITTLSHRTAQRVESNSRSIAAELLLDNGNVCTTRPFIKLLDGRGTECIGSTEHHFVAGSLILVSELAYGGSLAYTVNTHHHYDVRTRSLGKLKILQRRGTGFVFHKQCRYFFTQHVVELVLAHVLITLGTALNAVYDFECGFCTHISGYEYFLQLIKEIVVDGPTPYKRAFKFAEKTFFGFFKATVECFLFLFAGEEVEECHSWFGLLACKVTKKKDVPAILMIQ